jgi:hypothetical protein
MHNYGLASLGEEPRARARLRRIWLTELSRLLNAWRSRVGWLSYPSNQEFRDEKKRWRDTTPEETLTNL